MNRPQVVQLTSQSRCAPWPCGSASTSTEKTPKKRTAAAASGHSLCRSHRCKYVSVFMKRVSKRSERTAARLADLRIFASLRRFAIKDTVGTPRGPAFAGADARRHDALNRAVTARAPELPDAERRPDCLTCCGAHPHMSG